MLEKLTEDVCECWCEGFGMCCEKGIKLMRQPHSVKEAKDILLTLSQRDVHKGKRAGFCKNITT